MFYKYVLVRQRMMPVPFRDTVSQSRAMHDSSIMLLSCWLNQFVRTIR